MILGASGAVGSLAVQFVKFRQAHVVATAYGSDATDRVRGLGADAVIYARSGDAVDELRGLSPGGIDAALVLVAGEVQGSRWPQRPNPLD